MSTLQQPQLPPDVGGHLSALHRFWNNWNVVYYVLAISGVVFSIAATLLPEPFNRYAAAASAIVVGVLAVLNPQGRYYKYVRAWRVLNTAAVRYRSNLITLEELMTAYDDSNRILDEQDIKDQERLSREAEQKQGRV